MAKSTHTLGATGGTRTHEWRLGLFLILLLVNLPDSHFLMAAVLAPWLLPHRGYQLLQITDSISPAITALWKTEGNHPSGILECQLTTSGFYITDPVTLHPISLRWITLCLSLIAQRTHYASAGKESSILSVPGVGLEPTTTGLQFLEKLLFTSLDKARYYALYHLSYPGILRASRIELLTIYPSNIFAVSVV